MPTDPGTRPPNEMRRADRAVEDETWLHALMRRVPVGTLATLSSDQPFQNINLFVHDPATKRIYLHTAHVGRTRTNLEAGPKVCFSVHEMGRLLPADEALEFSVEYASAIVFGEARIVEAQREARHALQLLLDRYAPHLRPERDYRPITDAELRRTTVIALEIERWSGKEKRVPTDFPGAFRFGEHDPADPA